MDFFSYYLITETTTVQDLLTDPSNNATPFYEILDRFKQNGGEVLGQGKFAQVLYHPSWNYVLKIFEQDDHYLRFARFAMKNPRPSFPKFLDKPRKILPNFKRGISAQHLYFVRVEKLEPVTTDEYTTFKVYKSLVPTRFDDLIEQYKDNPGNLEYYNKRRDELIDLAEHMEKKYPSLKQLMDDWRFLEGYTQTEEGEKLGTMDDHMGNLMKRPNGEFVLIDPVWWGGDPMGDAEQARRMEYDYYGREDYDEDQSAPKMLNGGEKYKYKAPKPPPPFIPKPQVQEDIPF